MPKFQVRETFEIPDRELFVLAGSIVHGEIRTGMFVRVPLNSEAGIRLLIDTIEFTRHQNGEDVCLCIWSGPKFTEVLRGIDFRGETFEVAAEGGDSQ
jgi:hypothetical protein